MQYKKSTGTKMDKQKSKQLDKALNADYTRLGYTLCVGCKTPLPKEYVVIFGDACNVCRGKDD